jgi:hypothetical protein
MGSGVVIIPIAVIALLVVLAIAAGAVWRSGGLRERDLDEGEALRYHVPEGIDAAALVVSLQGEGFEAVPTPDSQGQELLIACPGGVDRNRAHVRATLQHATDLQGDAHRPPPVRFADE